MRIEVRDGTPRQPLRSRLIRTSLQIILDAQPDIEVIGEARDGREAGRLARELRPDGSLFDIRMPEVNRIDATRALAGPDVEDPMAAAVITTLDLDDCVHGALKAGARGFLLTDAGPSSSARRSMRLPTARR
jgi:DNA-binding NarL/FixJ family response regulator